MTGTSHPSKLRLRVEGMDCASCATKIQNALQRMPGVTEVSVSVAGGTVTVKHDQADTRAMSSQIAGLGYAVIGSEEVGAKPLVMIRPRPEEDAGHSHIHDHSPTDQSWWQTRKGQLTIASGATLAVAFAVGKAVPATEHWAFLLAMMVGLIPIAKRAISAAMAGTPFSIEMLMTIAAIGAVFIGATEEAATVVFLFLIGELLEGVAASRARASIQELTKLVPKTARLEEDGQVREVQADTLSVGATIQVRPGDRIRRTAS